MFVFLLQPFIVEYMYDCFSPFLKLEDFFSDLSSSLFKNEKGVLILTVSPK